MALVVIITMENNRTVKFENETRWNTFFSPQSIKYSLCKCDRYEIKSLYKSLPLREKKNGTYV